MTPARSKLRIAAPLAAAVLAVAGGGGRADDGRALYRGSIGWQAGADATSPRLPASYSACSNCHGAGAGGGREGALSAPPVNWRALTDVESAPSPYESEQAVLAAITQGVGRAGRPLSPAMPRYRLSEGEGAALISYLHEVGTRDDAPPGVTGGEIRLGTILPLSGPSAATGRDVLAGLTDRFSAVNAAGGVNGRRIATRAVDLADARAAQELLDTPIYALVGSMWKGDAQELERLLANRWIANLATLIVRPKAQDATPWDLDLLPPLDAQQAMLEGALAECDGDRLAVSIAGAPPPRPSNIRWVTPTDRLDMSGPAGCLGIPFGAAGADIARRATGWRKLIVSPLPLAVVRSGDEVGVSAWRRLGRAAANITVELLAQAGPALTERSGLDRAAWLGSFEPLPGAPARFPPGRRYVWDPAIVALTETKGGLGARGARLAPSAQGATP